MKGISDFISTVLIIAITISVGIALFNWIEPLSRSQANKVSDDSTNRLKCQSASLRITNGKLNTTATSNQTIVTAENTGNINLDTFNFNVNLNNGTVINTAATPTTTLTPSSKQTLSSSIGIVNDPTLISKVRLIATCNGAITVYDDLDGNTLSSVT